MLRWFTSPYKNCASSLFFTDAVPDLR